MMKTVWRTLMIVSVILGLFGIGVEQIVAADRSISETSGQNEHPRTDGEFIVWVATSTDSELSGIYGYHLDSGELFSIATDSETHFEEPDIDARVAVWYQTPKCPPCGTHSILGMDLVSGEQFVVADTAGVPAISGNLVIWSRYDESGIQIMGRDLSSKDQPFVIAHGSPSRPLVIDGDRIVWGEVFNAGQGGSQWKLSTIVIGEQDPIIIAEGGAIGVGGSWGWDVVGDLVVYIDSGFEVVATDLNRGEIARIPSGNVYTRKPSTDGRYIVWVREGQANQGIQWDLWGYDLVSRSLFQITNSPESDGDPDLNNGVLAWSRGLEIGYDSTSTVHAMDLEDMLPTVPVPGPNPPSTVSYFPETEHTLLQQFDEFWESGGGIEIFGFPITEPFEQLREADDQFIRVQYLERQRFEWHPANRDTPYEILLGRLGDELLLAQGHDWMTFPKADPSLPHYFPETAHSIAREFYDYWSLHGLEFGDEGVSHRESLALFGYPLSEPMIETNGDGDTVLTQYFERAVFEFHPDNPTPYQVLLRRPGAEIVAGWGW